MGEAYEATLAAIEGVLARETSAVERLQQVMQTIHDRHPQYEWVGLYLLQGEVLTLGPYLGAATEHTRIPAAGTDRLRCPRTR